MDPGDFGGSAVQRVGFEIEAAWPSNTAAAPDALSATRGRRREWITSNSAPSRRLCGTSEMAFGGLLKDAVHRARAHPWTSARPSLNRRREGSRHVVALPVPPSGTRRHFFRHSRWWDRLDGARLGVACTLAVSVHKGLPSRFPIPKDLMSPLRFGYNMWCRSRPPQNFKSSVCRSIGMYLDGETIRS